MFFELNRFQLKFFINLNNIYRNIKNNNFINKHIYLLLNKDK